MYCDSNIKVLLQYINTYFERRKTVMTCKAM